MTDPTRHTREVTIALFVTLLWSSSWILIRVGLDDESLQPISFAGLRYSVAAVALGAVIAARPPLRRRVAQLDRPTVRRFAVLGVVYFAVTQGAQFVAIDAQPAATSSLMLAPTALLVAVMSRRSIGEAVRLRQFAGSALIVVGAVLYFAGDLGATWIGMIASIVGLVANASGALLGRQVNRDADVSPVVVTAVSMAVGASILVVVGSVVEGPPQLSIASLAIIGWLAIVNTALAFTLWNAVQRRLAAVETAAINNTMLIQIAVLAWVFLGESPGVTGMAGIVVVSLGAFLSQAAPIRRRGHATSG